MKNGILVIIFFVFISVFGNAQTVVDPSDTTHKIIVCGCFNCLPEFIGEGGLQAYLKANIKYPVEEKKNNIHGVVYIGFAIEADGSVTNVRELKGVEGGPGLTKEAIRVFSAMPKWKPAFENGKAVRTEMRQPVKFTLTTGNANVQPNSPQVYDPNHPQQEPVSENRCYNDTAGLYHQNDSGKVFLYSETMPQFPGGQDSLMKFFQKNLKYQSQKNVEGTVYLSLIVEKDGSITNVQVAKEIPGAPELTKEALRVISLMPKWNPGRMPSGPVRVKMYQPVRFHL
jgi:TonB family protein